MRVLIVDDTPDYVALLGRFVAQEFPGAESIPYLPQEHSGRVPDLAALRPDVILLDYQLGMEQDGLDWLHALRAQPDCAPIIFLTAQGDEYVAVNAIRGGADDYIRKADLDADRLARAVEALVADTGLPPDGAGAETTEDGDAGATTDDTSDSDSLSRLERSSGYRVRRRIGEGSMSKVYLAERLDDDLSVALKLIDLKNVVTEEVRERFIQEAELASSIDSPYVVRIYDYGITPEYGFMVMELFSRGDLRQSIENGLDEADATLCLLGIAHSLDVIHGAGIVHRDLKPGNIMFRSNGSMALADFGISKMIQEATHFTTLGKVLGTPIYMSPEQGQGHKVDHRADLYSAGVIYYEMLTGEIPYDARDPVSLIRRHVSDPIPELPPDQAHLQPILERLLAKSPDDRYPHARALIDALQEHVR